jgi:spore coat protein CotH
VGEDRLRVSQSRRAEAAGIDYKTYHPIVLPLRQRDRDRRDGPVEGHSSWVITVRDDGDKARMQFVVSFEEVNPAGKFHGVSKIVLDMPNDDHTFMQERLGFTTMAEIFGMPAPCANSARVTINGQYYGLYVNEERVGGNYIKRVFPEAPDGDLYEGGWSPKTNQNMPNRTSSPRSGPRTTSRRCRPSSTCRRRSPSGPPRRC